MLVTTSRWNTTTNIPPPTLPNSAMTMPIGMVTIPAPSGMNDRAVKKMTNMKKPWCNPAMYSDAEAATPWQAAMMNWPRTVAVTMAPTLSR